MAEVTGLVRRWAIAFVGGLLAGVYLIEPAYASNHLDTATVIANPQANIGDFYAWTASDGQHLNLVMDIVGHSFSDKLSYVFHIDSGRDFGKTTATTKIVCRFPERTITDCRVGTVDSVRGDASSPDGLEGRNHRLRVFAGLRNDPYFNNVPGTRAAYQVAYAALKNGATSDAAGCPKLDEAAAKAILFQWRHTDGGPAANTLAHWTTSAIVISVDLSAVDRGGKMLAAWASTETAERRFDRAGRPLSKNALIGLTDADGIDNTLREAWNRVTPETSGQFVADMQKSLAFYDGLDGVCGNQFLADKGNVADSYSEKPANPADRYKPLALLLTDDRLWVNASSQTCTQLFAVELANLAARNDLKGDCGGRTLTYNASNTWRSLLVNGTSVGIDDGVDHDEHGTSANFPFLVPPDAQAINH